MEDLVKWLIIAVIAIAVIWGIITLAVVLITFVFNLALFTLDISFTGIIAGVLDGLFVLMIANWETSRRFRDPAILASVASHDITPEGIRFQLLESQLKNSPDLQRMTVIAALSSGAVAAWAVYLRQPQIVGSGVAFSAAHVVAWCVPIALCVLFLKSSAMQRARNERLRAQINAYGSRAKASVASPAKLDSLEREIAGVASGLSLRWPDEYRLALQRYVDENASALFVDARPADDLSNLLTSLASSDLEKLRNAKRQWEEFWAQYNALSKQLRISPRPSLARELDIFAGNIPKLTSLLPARRWDLFATALRSAAAELHILEANAEDVGADAFDEEANEMGSPPTDASTVVDPYQFLNVSPSTPIEEIHKVWRRESAGLKREYDDTHDQNEKKKIEAAMKEINIAWREIQKEVKCSRGDHHWQLQDKDPKSGAVNRTCRICAVTEQVSQSAV